MYKVYLSLLCVSNNIRTFAALNDTRSRAFHKTDNFEYKPKAYYIRSRQRHS